MSDQESGADTTGRGGANRSLTDDRDDALEASRARRALIAHMRHELHTPLNAIIGYSEMLLEEAESLGGERFIPDLHKMHDSGKQLLRLVDDVLNPSKIEADRIDLDPATFSSRVRHDLRTPLNPIIGYCEMLLEEAEECGRSSFSPELRKILTAARHLLTLIDDIVQFSRVESGKTSVSVAGSGISAIVHEVVSTVHPLAEGNTRSVTARHGSLLVVDDNETNRDLLSRRLEREGYTVAVAENGQQALEMIQAGEFDLVLLDLMMPGMNGYQVLQHLKADPALLHIPVIMISALDEIDSVVRCIEMGAEDYLPKPFNPVLLKARITASLDKKRLRDREVLYLRQIEEEKKRSDELLHVILPHEIVEELKATNAVRPRLHTNVAVLFCDIVGFTPYCEQRQPEEVYSNLQELIEVYEDLALRYDLQKIKTIGDAFMATAGLLKPVDNPVLNCVRCGLEMVSTTRRLPMKWDVRVGIHVGPVMAGVVGHRQYMFDLWGDTVNTAARAESHGASGSVNVSGTAWEQITDQYCGESLGLILVKGKGQMELFRVGRLRTTER